MTSSIANLRPIITHTVNIAMDGCIFIITSTGIIRAAIIQSYINAYIAIASVIINVAFTHARITHVSSTDTVINNYMFTPLFTNVISTIVTFPQLHH